jgi:hypothetical protein
MADDRHKVAMPARLGSQHAEAVLGIVVGDSLDQACHHFPKSIRRSVHMRIGLSVPLPGPPIPWQVEIPRPKIEPAASWGVLFVDVIGGVFAIGDSPAILHHPPVQVFGLIEADRDDASVAVEIARFTANDMVSDMIGERQARLLAATPRIAVWSHAVERQLRWPVGDN